MGLVKGKCTECGATLELNSEAQNECICKYCGSKFFVQDAINNYNVNIETSNVNIENAQVEIVSNRSKTECPKCGSHNLTLGKATWGGWLVREWSCVDCGNIWMHTEDKSAIDAMIQERRTQKDDVKKQNEIRSYSKNLPVQKSIRCQICGQLSAEKYIDKEKNDIFYCKNCDYAWITNPKILWFGIIFFGLFVLVEIILSLILAF